MQRESEATWKLVFSTFQFCNTSNLAFFLALSNAFKTHNYSMFFATTTPLPFSRNLWCLLWVQVSKAPLLKRFTGSWSYKSTLTIIYINLTVNPPTNNKQGQLPKICAADLTTIAANGVQHIQSQLTYSVATSSNSFFCAESFSSTGRYYNHHITRGRLTSQPMYRPLVCKRPLAMTH